MILTKRRKCRININGIWWTIRGCGEDDEALEIDGDTVFGITKFATAEIFVRQQNIKSEVIYRTIKHELCHAYLYSYGLIAETMGEEEFCNFLECHSEKLIKDAAYIFRKCFTEVNLRAVC